MEALTREEYRELLNNVGNIAKFFVQQIEEIKYNPDFYEAFNNINKNQSITIDDKDSYFLTPMRLIDRGNETICLIKNNKSAIQDYEDTIIYYLTVDFNKRLKMYIDYNMLERNEQNSSEIYFEILENYKCKECGTIYGSGIIKNEEEQGYKGCIFAKDNYCTMEYGKYDYEHLKVVLLDETYESETVIPDFKDLDKKTIKYKMTQGINNPVFLAHNEIQIAKERGRQRVR
ncbi:MAG: hypothetical protein IJL74_00060 [Bacilli bacterium]|nr:hypothetical protein [Bacilli bacterium]